MVVCHLQNYLFAIWQNSQMHTFQTWLNAERGMAKKLGAKLSVKPATISNVKHGRKPMPTRWIPHIVALSKNQLTYKQLVDHKVKEMS
jgi:hypothetical protein